MRLKAMSITWDAPIKPPSLKLVALASKPGWNR